MCLLHVTRVTEPQENISSFFVKHTILTAMQYAETRGPRLTANCKSSKRCAACRHA
jgi:ferredoxin